MVFCHWRGLVSSKQTQRERRTQRQLHTSPAPRPLSRIVAREVQGVRMCAHKPRLCLSAHRVPALIPKLIRTSYIHPTCVYTRVVSP